MSLRKRRYEEKKENNYLKHLVDTYMESLVVEDKENVNPSEVSESSEELFSYVDLCKNSNKSSSESDCELEVPNCTEISQLQEWIVGESDCELKVPNCIEISQLQEWIVKFNVPHTHVDELIKILRPRLLPSLPKCTKTLLRCDVSYDLEVMESSNGMAGEFVYFGIKNQLISCVNIEFHENKVLELIINIDGFSPFKSSSCTVWPILCKVYTKQDIYQPFSVAVYSGSAKPKYATEYLKKFVKEINEIQQYGVNIKNKHFNVKIKFFVCDTPARSFLKCIKSHTAFNACERCTVTGKKVNSVTVFLQTDAKRKTDEDFKNFIYEDCHTSASILTAIEPSINMISQFILDPMHLLYLGCTKRILEYLLSASNFKIRLSSTQKLELKKRTTAIFKDIPEDFPRKMRSTDHYVKYKAVEYKFFLLYAAAVVFKKLLSNEVYNHLMLFVVACRLLHGKKSFLNVAQAKEFLIIFVKQASNLYGETFMSLNVHNLIHICDDVKNTDCSLDEIGAFPFESYLSSISCALRSPKHILKQYCKRQSEKKKFLRNDPVISPILEIRKKKSNKILKIKYKGFILSNVNPNNTVLLEDRSIGEIQEFFYENETVYIKVKKFNKKEPVFTSPCDSSIVNIWEVSRLSKTSMIVPVNSIIVKYVKFHIRFSEQEEVKLFVVSLLH